MIVEKHKLTFWEIAASTLFWSWNLIFLVFMGLGFAPLMLPQILDSVQQGSTPVMFLVNALLLTLIPVASLVLGWFVLRRAPARLFALGYVVEGPLMLLLAIRLFVIRQSTPGVDALLALAGLGLAAFLWHVLDPHQEQRGRRVGLLRLVGLTFTLLVCLYAAVWIAFYAVPAIGAFLRWAWENITHPLQFIHDARGFIKDVFSSGGLTWLPFTLLGMVLMLYTATLFVLAPIAVPVLGIRAWLRTLLLQARRQGWALPAAAVVVTALLAGALFTFANQQPQKRAFTLLAQPPASPTQARSLLNQQEAIRRGLLNAYLAPFRYISAVGEVNHITDLYRSALHLPVKTAAEVQVAYEDLATPLLYQPVHPLDPVKMSETGVRQDNFALQREPAEAARLYQQFFDVPINEGERKTVVSAARSTWSGGQAEAAWQAVDEHTVHLSRQEINVREHTSSQQKGVDWAEVELYEVYENRTQTRQEVIYYFNLPESAVLTGVWLGYSPDRSQRFAFQVASRGAAQEVYRAETRRNVDPALLEQIGPRQYRLRAFPVEVPSIRWDQTRTRKLQQEPTPLYLWMTYSTLPVDGGWPLPRLAFKRNIFWDSSTTRLVNGKLAQAAGDEWMPASLPATTEVQPAAHRFDFPNGQTVLIQPVEKGQEPQLPSGLRLALVIDRSHSMQAHAQQAGTAIARLRALSGASVDVYLTASPYRGEGASLVSLNGFNPDSLLYYGGQNPAELLAQFDALRGERAYDGILVLTDGSAYELGQSAAKPAAPDAPIWMVHLDSDIPLGYDDATLEAVQASGGGVVSSLDEALARLAVNLSAGKPGAAPASALVDRLDGYTWTVLPTQETGAFPGADEIAPEAGEDGFLPLLARRLVLAEMHRGRGQIKELTTLDALNALAVKYGIVTPYSSMIVLVQANQQRMLDRLELQGDRFTREFEDLKNTTPATAPLVGVPEPQEWLLILSAALLLAWFAYRRKEMVSR